MTRVARAAVVVSLAAAVLVTVAACRSRPTPGGPCAALDRIACAGTDRALVCEAPAPSATSGAWVEIPCKGARGCGRRGETDDCDDTVALEGDPCPRNPPLDYACTPDHARALACDGGRYGLWRACRGPEGCKVEGGRNIRCDTTLGEVGDPCGQAGTYACTADHQAMLVCAGAALAAASSCRGPAGCRVERDSRKVDCDDAVAQEGDPCDQEGRIACAVDRKVELGCVHGKFAKKRDCRRTDCRLDGNELFCE